MKRYKICPGCGAQNLPSAMECEQCGYDLMNTPAVDPETVAQTEQKIKAVDNLTEADGQDRKDQPTCAGTSKEPLAAPVSAPAVSLVRICACGEINPPQARKCQRCGEDISDILPTASPASAAKRYALEEIGTGRCFPVPAGTIVIGRENALREILADKLFVSRIHAKLTVAGDKLYIENLSHTNYTYVNNERIPEGKTELKPSDEIGLGGLTIDGRRQEQAAYFLVEALL